MNVFARFKFRIALREPPPSQSTSRAFIATR
jgi:hypothetical protein